MSDTENLHNDVQKTAAHASDALNQLKDDAGRVIQSATDAGRAGVETLKGKISDGREAVRTKISDGRDVVRGKLNDGQAAVQDATERAKVKGNELVTNLSTQIEQNPLQAIAIAAGVGVVVGLLLRRH